MYSWWVITSVLSAYRTIHGARKSAVNMWMRRTRRETVGVWAVGVAWLHVWLSHSLGVALLLSDGFLEGLGAIFHIGPIACGIHEGIGLRILLQTLVFRFHPVIAAVCAEEDVAGQRLE